MYPLWLIFNEKKADKIKISLKKTNYAHYLFDKRIGIEG